MFQLKPLSREAIPGALAKAERYRLLREPWQAESICRDILAIDRDNAAAVKILLLALTDQFPMGVTAQAALDLVHSLKDDYERTYYTGIVHERRAWALFRSSDFRAGQAVYALLRHAMEWYEDAILTRPAGNDDALLRWNACARFLDAHPELAPREERMEPVLSE